MQATGNRIREIPYNYTSFSDREIVNKFLGEASWEILEKLRSRRKTGISARMLFEVLGDMWVIVRNPYLQDDMFQNAKRRKLLVSALQHRLDQIAARANDNELVQHLLVQARESVANFQRWLNRHLAKRRKALARFARITNKENIDFSALARVSHVTDATDWRVEYPMVILAPDREEEVAPLVRACIELGLTIIARGGGTGYTGGAIPLYEETAIINTEKLDRINNFVPPQVGSSIGFVQAQAGVITKHLADFAETQGFIFAVDPTSINASTLGGNIAMNSGGKKAVAWGTAVDNLYAWTMVDPDGNWVDVRRLDTNFGKVHRQPKIIYEISRFDSNRKKMIGSPEILELAGKSFRRQGLGKDVTDKYLGGIPGVQKEGTDGIITSATFMLHRMPSFTRTVCLEFFGDDLGGAVNAIHEIRDHFDNQSKVLLTALEHLDERYIRAVKYNVKSASGLNPKMVLFSDVSGEREEDVDEAARTIVGFVEKYGAEGFIASTPQARKNFWEDRSRTAAIAAHTNAFKINEDVVIPIQYLADYTREIEIINIEFSLKNKIAIVDGFSAYLRGPMPELKKMRSYVSSNEREIILDKKREEALSHLSEVREQWSFILENFSETASAHKSLLKSLACADCDYKQKIIDLLLRRRLRISFRASVEKVLKQIFSGSELESVRKKMDSIHESIRSGRLFVALHMHAGDGNVHTNIPVNSNDYQMMRDAEYVVERIMKLARKFKGVISGEHGIGLTKYRYLDEAQKRAFADYKAKVDPHGHFNKGKLLPESMEKFPYTPSLRLLRQEALILEQSQLHDLNESIKNCLRCGKCKKVCSTHVPRANLLYSPRNKILGSGLLIEAFLYEEQTRRGVSWTHFQELNSIADHCTVCHKCLKPCPVDIDFGDVTIQIRNLLLEWEKKRSSIGSKVAMHYLSQTEFKGIQLFYKVLLRQGFWAQRLGTNLLRSFKLDRRGQIPVSTNEPLGLVATVHHSLRKKLPEIPANTLRGYLGLDDPTMIPILRNPHKVTAESEAVFFFPGCGAERLHSQVGLAALAMLYEQGIQIVLPPSNICCGYPQKTSGQLKLAKKITVENSVLFHRISNTLNYLDISTVLVICGTCLKQLEHYDLETIFPGYRLLDTHEYLFEKGVSLKNLDANSHEYIYHDPCHSPLKNTNVKSVVDGLMAKPVTMSKRCCGEAGTFSVARPDVATQVRFSKEEELNRNIRNLITRMDLDAEINAGDTQIKDKARINQIRLLTSCPACLQGLTRYKEDTGLKPTYIILELVEKLLGENWMSDFISKAKSEGIERVLL